MKIVYTEKHQLHSPKHQLIRGEIIAPLETPERAEIIINTLSDNGFIPIQPRIYSIECILKVHSSDYIDFLRNAYQEWIKQPDSPQIIIPDTFAFRILGHKPRNIIGKAGWYCLDTTAPIDKYTFESALYSAYAALTGADLILEGNKQVYVLNRPPGHHAGIDYCAGFCYLNNAALVAVYLKTHNTGRKTRIAILDLDYHHGNGTQQIFYDSNEVMFLSIHADPNSEYPYFWGYADEIGEKEGEGFNINIPLERGATESTYFKAIGKVLNIISQFSPNFLIISFGVDTLTKDPVGGFELTVNSFSKIGSLIASLNLPTLIIQEGGYVLQDIGKCVLNFLNAFISKTN